MTTKVGDNDVLLNEIENLSQYISKELKDELRRLILQQKIYLDEIKQLKGERNKLYLMLKNRENTIVSDNKRMKHREKKKQNLTIDNLLDVISVLPSKDLLVVGYNTAHNYFDLNMTNSTKNTETNTVNNGFDFDITNSAKISKSNTSYKDVSVQCRANDPDIYHFSKKYFISKLEKYKNPIFERARDVLIGAESGDAMLNYFVNATGTRINSYVDELKQLRDDIIKRQKKTRVNAISVLSSRSLKKNIR